MIFILYFSDDPTIELSVVPSVGQSSSDPQKMLCSVTGFDPKIKWLSQSEEKTGRLLDATMMEDGRVKVYSEILVPQQEWNQEITVKQELQLQLLRKAPVFAQVNMPNVKGTQLFFCQRSSCNLNRIQGAFSDIRSGL